MKNKNWIIGGVALALAAVGVILIFKKPKAAGGTSGTSGTSGGGTSGTSGTSGTGGGTDVFPPADGTMENDFYDFIVTTSSSNLNIRENDSTSSAIIGSIPKGTVIKASPWSEGWYLTTYPNGVYSKGLCFKCGFVSSQYLTKA